MKLAGGIFVLREKANKVNADEKPLIHVELGVMDKTH